MILFIESQSGRGEKQRVRDLVHSLIDSTNGYDNHRGRAKTKPVARDSILPPGSEGHFMLPSLVR